MIEKIKDFIDEVQQFTADRPKTDIKIIKASIIK